MKKSVTTSYETVITNVRNNSITANDETLERIKTKFSHVIFSTRSMFYVRTLKDLVDLLEKRAIDGRDREELLVSLVECTNSEEDEEIPRHVLDTIAGEIGRKWWDLARYLDLSDGTIMEIEDKHRFSLKEQAYQALVTFCRQTKKGKKTEILAALEKTRRYDLKSEVERELNNKNSPRKK